MDSDDSFDDVVRWSDIDRVFKPCDHSDIEVPSSYPPQVDVAQSVIGLEDDHR